MPFYFIKFFLKNQIFSMKKNFYWFTIIELLVVIAIIWILSLWLSKINFNPLIDKKRFLMLNNSIASSIESIRNNSLYWKSFSWWTWFINPEESILAIKTWSWNDNFILTYSWWNTSKIDTSYKIDFFTHWTIDKLNCKTITWTSLSYKDEVDIIFKRGNFSFSWCDIDTKILDIIVKYKSFTWSILLNSVSWLIERK